MATKRFATLDVVEPVDSHTNLATSSSVNINNSDEKRENDMDTKIEPVSDLLPNYPDIEAGDNDKIDHEATKDDILTHTIHVEDDPTMVALTFRTWFLGMF